MASTKTEEVKDILWFNLPTIYPLSTNRQGGVINTYGTENGQYLYESPQFTSFFPLPDFLSALMSIISGDMEFSSLWEYEEGSMGNAMVAHGIGVPMDEGWIVLMEKL